MRGRFHRKAFRPYPPAVCRALDFFVWAALDDSTFLPTDSRRFTDDEQHRNSVLNAHFFPDEFKLGRLQGVDEWPLERLREKDAAYSPCYFPDNLGDGSASVLKHAYLMNYVTFRVDGLKRAAQCGKPVEAGRRVAQATCLVRPDGYLDYYRRLQQSGKRFVDATSQERELVAVESLRDALAVHPEDARGDGWYVVDHDIAETILFEIADLEARGR